MLREAATNVAKHAMPGSACVLMAHARDGWLLIKVNSQMGEERKPRTIPDSGLGLRLLKARVESLGGRLETGPRGGRWTLTAS